MRLFAAVVPPADVIAHLDAAVTAVRDAHPDLAWIPTQRWHLTLAFYGEVPDGDVPRVQRRVTRAAKAKGATGLDLRFSGSGQFGERVLWAGVQGDRERLRALAGALATDQRPYRPHLTLARVRHGADPRPAAHRLATYVGPDWRATEVVLFRSHLGPQPRHEPLVRQRLTP